MPAFRVMNDLFYLVYFMERLLDSFVFLDKDYSRKCKAHTMLDWKAPKHGPSKRFKHK